MLKIPFQVLPAKAPNETVTVGIGFSRRIPVGITITACAVTVSVWEGVDQDAGSMPAGAADFSGDPLIRQDIAAGLDGVDYLVEARVTLSNGQARVGSVILPVRKGGS